MTRVGADPADHLDGQLAVAGVADDHDGRVPGLPLAGGDRGRVVRRASRIAVQDVAPGSSTATKE
ncbi:hypothetical protein ACFWGI_19455 [Streptomyces niveus]|uniref:hypothetical protein n=1 Tax=Streptomyces niveus TaxID=193462 RepID=UPI00364E2774